jgi:hypothetical protein
VDVYDRVVCYEGDAPRLRERWVPSWPAPPLGWRCVGTGDGRTCEPRAKRGGPFVCAGGRCEQRYPRLPDDGQWECIDFDGAIMCRGGGPAAGVVASPLDRGWTCGARRGAPSERICVDFSPDLPDGAGWRCWIEHSGGERRLCVHEDGHPRLSGRCDVARGCGLGRACVSGRCVPLLPRPACWLDTDCGAGSACRDGSCRERTP